ncbi:unannotated protein [freshwater metagenome]|uniref:Unannotated protein n=1 Tax=freshwater metagenome TaxID=449393 RepID=A0A6J7KQV4_9ZZZZ|nr:hypothetical protein [Actinomycetota bacterium]
MTQPLAGLIADLTAQLSPVVDETLPLDPQTKVLVRAYVVLAHAEFENHVETLCTARAQAIRTAAAGGVCHPGLIALVLRYADDIKGQRVSPGDVAKVAATAAGLYGGLVRANNGIKRSDLEALIAPLGVTADALAADAGEFADAAEALAALRGPAAHVGDAGFEHDVYPSNARDAVKLVLSRLAAFEALLALP